jgi:two-component system chemotaxis sensor kinase CheA
VIDTGVGIEADKMDSIFESFQDGDGKSSGSGLGLSLTKKYSEYLGGSISVESEIGGGSKFVVKLPRICKTKAGEFIEIKTLQDEEPIDEDTPSDSSKSDKSWTV